MFTVQYLRRGNSSMKNYTEIEASLSKWVWWCKPISGMEYTFLFDVSMTLSTLLLSIDHVAHWLNWFVDRTLICLRMRLPPSITNLFPDQLPPPAFDCYFDWFLIASLTECESEDAPPLAVQKTGRDSCSRGWHPPLEVSMSVHVNTSTPDR